MPADIRSAPIEADAVIIGAGPVGLFQAFQLGLLEVSSHIIDALPYVGGQCVELYGDKPIYDIPGIAMCTGRELIDNLQKQVAPFKPTVHLGEVVNAVERQADGRLLIATSKGKTFHAKALFIAAGVGAFQPRMPGVEALHHLDGTQVFTASPSPSEWTGRDIIVLGDSETALSAAIEIATAPHKPASVTLLHRRNVFTAEPATTAKFHALVEAGHIAFVAGQLTDVRTSDGCMTAVTVLTSEGTQESMPADALLVLLGLSPKLGAIAHWGLDMERRQIKVNTETFATDVPGVFAVGDINTYPGKKKLILCGFHECVLAAFGAAPLIFPDKKVLLQYTTTSTRLHTLLGVNSLAPVESSQKTTL
jgi:thioredoxin reductase (NADPH)